MVADSLDRRASDMRAHAKRLLDIFHDDAAASFGYVPGEQGERHCLRLRPIRLDRSRGAQDPEARGFGGDGCVHQPALLMRIVGAAARDQFGAHRPVKRLGGTEMRGAIAPDTAFEERFAPIIARAPQAPDAARP